jgi:hypothetical protein
MLFRRCLARIAHARPRMVSARRGSGRENSTPGYGSCPRRMRPAEVLGRLVRVREGSHRTHGLVPDFCSFTLGPENDAVHCFLLDAEPVRQDRDGSGPYRSSASAAPHPSDPGLRQTFARISRRTGMAIQQPRQAVLFRVTILRLINGDVLTFERSRKSWLKVASLLARPKKGAREAFTYVACAGDGARARARPCAATG